MLIGARTIVDHIFWYELRLSISQVFNSLAYEQVLIVTWETLLHIYDLVLL